MHDDPWIAIEFQSRFAADRAEGLDHGLAHYLRLFPGHEEEIAREYLALADVAPPRAAADDPRIGPYRLLGEIGRGGQGIVHKAFDERLQRLVALKVLHRGGDADPSVLSRFEREARVVSGLDHPGICTVYEFGFEDNDPWIAMRLIEGEPFSRFLAKLRGETEESAPKTLRENDRKAWRDPEPTGRALTSRDDLVQVLRVLSSAARALHVAHEAGVIHRDVKPANIMVTQDGQAVLTDFGLARRTDHGHTLTQEGDLFGTPAYLAPEQLQSSATRTDRRADIWSLGVVLFESVTGVRPFEGPTREALYQAILTASPKPARWLSTLVGEDLQLVLETALAKDPNHRYQDAEAFAQDLVNLSRGLPVAARRLSIPGRLSAWAKARPALAASLAGTILSLGIGFATSLWLYDRARIEAASAQREALSATAARGAAEEALARFEQLSDLRVAEDLLRRERGLWPALPARVPAMQAWIVEAQELLQHRPEHLRAAADLAARALERGNPRIASERALLERLHPDFYAEVEASLDRRQRLSALVQEGTIGADDPLIGEAENEWRALQNDARYIETTTKAFDDPRDAWRYEALERLLAALRTIEKELQGIKLRLARADSIQSESIDEEARAWDACITDLKTSDRYGKLDMKPIPGLVPLGRNRDSKLWEFWHVLSGRRPPWVGDFQAGRTRPEVEAGIVLILIPGGRYTLGAQRSDPSAPNYDPQALPHEVTVYEAEVRPFLISKYELTQDQYLRVMGTNPSFCTPGMLQGNHLITLLHPVEQLDYAQSCEVLMRLGLVLPTEVQWEIAARGGSSTPWATGDALASLQGYANLADKSVGQAGIGWEFDEELEDTHTAHSPVGAFRGNGYGLHDVHGNIWEWCRDRFSRLSIPPREGDGLRRDDGQKLRILRGGCFRYTADHARSAARMRVDALSRNSLQGVRPAMDLPLLPP